MAPMVKAIGGVTDAISKPLQSSAEKRLFNAIAGSRSASAYKDLMESATQYRNLFPGEPLPADLEAAIKLDLPFSIATTTTQVGAAVASSGHNNRESRHISHGMVDNCLSSTSII